MARGTEMQPVSNVQWVPRDTLRANAYNPNHVAPAELRLLRESIRQSGWTQPIVARPDGEIVDGYHRWLIAGEGRIAALTGGLVPVVRLKAETPHAEQVAATIRHNRARGEHGVVAMASIVRNLLAEEQCAPEELVTMLGMEEEEIERLADRSGMPVRAGQDAFGTGWVPR